MKIGCIVEGHGDEQAIRVLLRRFAVLLRPGEMLEIPIVLRVSRSKLVKPGEIERAVELVARRLGEEKTILVLIDSDDDLPCQLGPKLLERALLQRPNARVGVVLANREFEAWFLAAVESLAGKRGLPAQLEAPADPESIQDAKGWFSKQMGTGRRYSETLDQPAFAAVFDLDVARRSPSFDKCYREIVRLLGEG